MTYQQAQELLKRVRAYGAACRLGGHGPAYKAEMVTFGRICELVYELETGMTHFKASNSERAERIGVDSAMLEDMQNPVRRKLDTDDLTPLGSALRRRLDELGSNDALFADGEGRLRALLLAEAGAEDWLDEAGEPQTRPAGFDDDFDDDPYTEDYY
jgi:hypothetical protein